MEYFEILNEDGTKSGKIKERELVHRDGDLHAASHVWVYRFREGKIEILLQKRCDTKDSFPDCFDVSSAGHLDPGEDFIDAAVREMKEELGLTIQAEQLEYLYNKRINITNTFHNKTFKNHEIITIYLYQTNENLQTNQIHFQKEEISTVCWMDASEILVKAGQSEFKHCLDMEEYVKIYNILREKHRLHQQMQFLLEIDKEKSIFRQTYLSDGSRKENDAEHSWHLAMMAVILSEYANEQIDLEHTITMVLIHDLVEIYAGDTYAYDVEGNTTKAKREQEAASTLYGLLPKDQGEKLYYLWKEFEDRSTPEAKFANTLDKVQPILLTNANGGKSWKEHAVQKSWILNRNRYTREGSETIWEVFRKLIEKNVQNGNIINDDDSSCKDDKDSL